MTVPAIALRRLLAGLMIGAAVGLVHGFLTPLRRRHPVLADLLLLPAMGWAWLYFMFAVCRGDLRAGGFFSLVLGAILWETTAGRLLAPVFTGFWRLGRKILFFSSCPSKNFWKN